MNDLKTYTVKEAEDILKVKGKAIRGYIKDGKVNASKIGKAGLSNRKKLRNSLIVTNNTFSSIRTSMSVNILYC